MSQQSQTVRTGAKDRELETDGMQISTQNMDRDLLQVSGALLVGVPEVTLIVTKMREPDQAVLEILAQWRGGTRDIEQIPAARRLAGNDQQTLAALLRLQEDKPLLLKSLARLASKEDWQELLDSAA